MKRIASLLMCLVMAVASFSFVGCAPDVPDTPETLEIYCWDAGYGTQWCTDMVELFKQQDWVKEKYPNNYLSMDIEKYIERASVK